MIAEGSVSDNIRSSDLLITGMSTIGLESIVMGVPTIVVKNNIGFFYDPIPNSVPKELWKSCGSPEEISDAINYYRNRTSEEVSKHKKLSAQIKKDCLTHYSHSLKVMKNLKLKSLGTEDIMLQNLDQIQEEI